jgi:hypothetical protein
LYELFKRAIRQVLGFHIIDPKICKVGEAWVFAGCGYP